MVHMYLFLEIIQMGSFHPMLEEITIFYQYQDNGITMKIKKMALNDRSINQDTAAAYISLLRFYCLENMLM